MQNVKRLTGLPAHLRQQGYDCPAYRWIREAAIDGIFPACQINSIWHFRVEDTLAIVKALDLARMNTSERHAA